MALSEPTLGRAESEDLTAPLPVIGLLVSMRFRLLVLEDGLEERELERAIRDRVAVGHPRPVVGVEQA